MARQSQEIDAAYFRAYAGSGKSYSQVYADYSRIDDCLALFNQERTEKVSSIAVLGAATGLVAADLRRHFSVQPDGCEINRYAWSRIPARQRSTVALADMREFVLNAHAQGVQYDFCFTNSLVYLEPAEVPGFLQLLAKTMKLVHFHSSFSGDACRDPYRKTLRSYSWWRRQFVTAGFSVAGIDHPEARFLFVRNDIEFA